MAASSANSKPLFNSFPFSVITVKCPKFPRRVIFYKWWCGAEEFRGAIGPNSSWRLRADRLDYKARQKSEKLHFDYDTAETLNLAAALKWFFHLLLAAGGKKLGWWSCIPTVTEAGVQKYIYIYIWHWALAWIPIQIQDLEVLKPGRKDEWSRWATIYKRFHFLLKDSFITYSDAAVFYYKSDWETTVELWLGKPPPPHPPHNAGTQMWIPTWCGRAKKKKKTSHTFTSRPQWIQMGLVKTSQTGRENTHERALSHERGHSQQIKSL